MDIGSILSGIGAIAGAFTGGGSSSSPTLSKKMQNYFAWTDRANAEKWQQAGYDLAKTTLGHQVNQYNRSLAEAHRQFNVTNAEQRSQFQTSLLEGSRQFEESLGEGRRQFDASLQRDATKIQTAVADAQAAGVHPLFALGMSGGVSGGGMAGGGVPSPGAGGGSSIPGGTASAQFIPGQSPSGSFATDGGGRISRGMAVGAALRDIGATIQDAEDRRTAAKSEILKQALLEKQIQQIDHGMKQDDVLAQAMLSDRARNTQAGLARGRPGGMDDQEAQPVKINTPWFSHTTKGYTTQEQIEQLFGGGTGEVYGAGMAVHEAGRGILGEKRHERISKMGPLDLMADHFTRLAADVYKLYKKVRK